MNAASVAKLMIRDARGVPLWSRRADEALAARDDRIFAELAEADGLPTLSVTHTAATENEQPSDVLWMQLREGLGL